MSVVVIEPWDFVSEHGASHSGEVLAIDGDLRLIRIAGREYVTSPRTDGAFALVPAARDGLGSAPWGKDQWRGVPPALLAQIT